MKIHRICACVMLSCVSAALGAPPTESLPIREVTVFKDGHAMVLRSGTVKTDSEGDVVLGELPKPVLGTFWSFEDESEAALRSVRASRREVEFFRQPQNVEELIVANIGKKIQWSRNGDSVDVTILQLLVTDPSPATPTPNRIVTHASQMPLVSLSPQAPPPARQISKTVLLQFDDGSTQAISLTHGMLQSVVFTEAPESNAVIRSTIQEERLTMDLEWENSPAPEANIGLMYVERGLRWIPSYRVTMLDEGKARVELQATLINELADLEDVSCNLVIGVPRFEFEHTVDPMALSDVLASLGPYFQRASATGRGLSNAIMGQTARMGDSSRMNNTNTSSSPELVESSQTEDLYIFAIDHVSLLRGERMIIPFHTFEASFESVYKLDLPFEPPMGARRNFNTEQQRKLAELMSQPKAMHVLRLTNTSEHPITTAPALIVQENGMPLAQGMLTYTSSGASVDLEVTAAVDIQVGTESSIGAQQPEKDKWQGYRFNRIDLLSGCDVTNRKARPVRVEVRAYALGLLDSANENAESVGINVLTESAIYSSLPDAYAWWRSWSWPWWWMQRNGAARIEWTLDLDPGESIELEWKHHYFWKI